MDGILRRQPCVTEAPTERNDAPIEAAGRWHGLAAVGSALVLLVGASALAPGASASGGATHSCANKVFALELETSTNVNTPFKETVKSISTQGIACAAAYKFLTLALNDRTAVVPEHFKCKLGHCKVPAGLIPELCTRPGARIQYALRGG